MEQVGGFGKGAMATPQGLRMDMGARGRDEGALSGIIRSNELQGRSLIQVGENCNICISGIFPFFPLTYFFHFSP